MKKGLLDRIPENILKSVAGEKGYAPLHLPEGIEDVKRWLMGYYRKRVEEVLAKGGSVLDVAGEAMSKVRSLMGIPTEEPSSEAGEKPAVQSDIFATATMAKIYEKQGLLKEAAGIYEKLLRENPENAEWRRALERLTGKHSVELAGAVQAPEERIPSGPSVGANAISGDHVTRPEPYFLLDMEDLPRFYGRDGIVLMAVGPEDLYAYWEVRQESFEKALMAAGADGKLTLRLLEIKLEEGGALEVAVRDEAAGDLAGEFFMHGLKPGAFYRCAIGLKAGGHFYPVAHSKPEATSRRDQSRLAMEEWMEVDQKSLLWRSREAAAVEVDGRVKLSLRERALLHLHALGKYAASGLSGLSVDRLDELLGPVESSTGRSERADVSSPGSVI